MHGEYRHLLHHAQLAESMGVASDNVVLSEDGDVLRLDAEGLVKDGSVPAGYLYVDGAASDVDHGILRDRKVLASEGMVMVVASVDVIIQAMRLRDGSRRITHITEVMGMEGDVIITQDLLVYEILGEDANGKLKGRHRSTGVGRPRFWDRARYYGEEQRLAAALDSAEVKDP